MPGGLRVGRVAFVLLAGSVLGLALVAGLGRASLYAPDDTRFVVPVGADGKAVLDYDEFKRRLAILLNAADYRKKDNGQINSDHEAFLKRIELMKGKKPSVIETIGLTADLIRVGQLMRH